MARNEWSSNYQRSEEKHHPTVSSGHPCERKLRGLFVRGSIIPSSIATIYLSARRRASAQSSVPRFFTSRVAIVAATTLPLPLSEEQEISSRASLSKVFPFIQRPFIFLFRLFGAIDPLLNREGATAVATRFGIWLSSYITQGRNKERSFVGLTFLVL